MALFLHSERHFDKAEDLWQYDHAEGSDRSRRRCHPTRTLPMRRSAEQLKIWSNSMDQVTNRWQIKKTG